MARACSPALAILFTAAVTASCTSPENSAPNPGGSEGGKPGNGEGRGGGSGSSTGGSGGSTGPNATGGSGPGSGGSGNPGTAGAGGGSSPGSDGGVAPGDGAPPASGEDWSWLSKPVPVIWITVSGAAIAAPGLPKAQRTVGNMKVIYDHDGSALTSIAGKTVALDSPILIEHRGSSSYGFYAEKSYGFEFQDAMKQPVGHPLHGMPKNADWALVSCYSDKSCLRNSITYAIGREMSAGTGRWAPRSRWADVYIDGRFQGLYQLTEKPKDDKFRVNLPKPANPMAPPPEHGYMISADGDARSLSWKFLKPTDEFLDQRARAAPPGTNNRRWKFRAPSSEDMTAAQRAYVQSSFDKLTSTLEGASWKSAVEVGSFVDYFLISELSNNVDAYFKSFYFYKMPDPAGGKWSMGPMWDFDIAYGNTNYYFRYCTNITNIGPLAKQSPASAVDKDLPPPPYLLNPLRDAEFKNQMRCRWNELRKAGGPLDISAIEARMDAFVAHIKTAKERDIAKWKNIGLHVWPNNYVGATWADEVQYLRFWIRKRIAWIDGSLPGTCASAPMPPAVMLIPAPPSKTVDRSRQAYGGEATLRHSDYVDIDGTTPPQWSCPR